MRWPSPPESVAALRDEREIGEADRAQELQPLDDFAADALGDEGFARREGEIDGRRERAVQRQRSEVGDREAADFDGQRFRPQALAAAGGAGRRGHEVHHVLAIAVAAGFVDAVAQVGKDAVKAGARRFVLGRAVDQDVLMLRRQVFERRLQVDAVAVGGQVDEPEQVLRGGARAQPAIEQRLRPVGDDFGGIEIVERAEAVALGAGAKGGVEVKLRGSSLGTSRPQSGQAMEDENNLLFAVGEWRSAPGRWPSAALW